jgi:ABC-type multidrug transport system fused ATPase/permease subunit
MGKFGALFNKNWIRYKRATCGSVCEIGFPIFIALMWTLIGSLKTVVEKVGDQKYMSTSNTCWNQLLYPPTSFTAGNYGSAAVWLKPIENICPGFDYSEKPPKAEFKVWRNFKYCDLETNKDDKDNNDGGRIVIIPKPGTAAGAAKIGAALQTEFEGAGYSVWGFDTEAEFLDEIQKATYGRGTYVDSAAAVTVANQACMAIVLNKADLATQGYEYTLRFNNTMYRRGEYDHWDTSLRPQIEEQQEAMGVWDEQRNGGTAYLMQMIDNFILQYSTNSGAITGDAYIKNVFTNVPTPGFKKSDILATTNSGATPMFFIILATIVMYIRLILALSVEKELRIQENLRNMGMSVSMNIWATWLFRNVIHLIVSIIFAAIIKGGFFTQSNYLSSFLLYWLVGEFLIASAFAISGMFDQSKKAVFAGLCWFLFHYILGILVDSLGDRTLAMNNAISLSPFAGIRLASVNMATFEQNYRDFNVESYWEEIEYYKYGTFVMITLAEIIILQFLGFYLEWVVPSEYGAKEHPCFCCRKKSIPLVWAGQADDKSGTDPSYIEEVEAGIKMQKAQGRTLTIENLRKQYSNGKVAVQKLDLEMYTDQIFALLGHNGAGKSTTISVISGLLEKSAGKIDVYG